MYSDKIEEKISCKGISSNSNRDVVYPYLDMIVDPDIPYSNITMCYTGRKQWLLEIKRSIDLSLKSAALG